MVPLSPHESQFLEAQLVRQADGELKNTDLLEKIFLQVQVPEKTSVTS